jgi:SAM-dependent methyltransferase
MVRLPPRLWRAYSVARPIRLVLERLGLRDPHAAGLGPFLSTPASLIDPLFELAQLRADDTLLDIGCGDGRLAIAAAQVVGCRAIGVEHDADLVERARRAASGAGVGDRVSIRHGDGRDADLSAVTVAFMFLPMDVVVDVVADTLERLPVGARLIAHEQTPLPPTMSPRPDASHAVIARDAVTVAHVWSRRRDPVRVR